MKHLADLDFALKRAQRARRRQALIAAVALVFGLQLGAAVWRWQTLQDEHAALRARQQQMLGQGARSQTQALSAEQTKLAGSAQAMLSGLAVPWDSLLQAIEAARPPRVVVESITPHAADGLVSLSVSSPDFAQVATLVHNLAQQEPLFDVMLASEAWPDNGDVLRAVVTARWGSVP
ncbi:MAG: hypothetical protein PHH58_10640 [Rhodoferax sp.]|nr:hypothetical protein [Rhodoferax sp.]